MSRNRVVITGIGVISPIGIGKDKFFAALRNGASGIKPISSFDVSEFKAKHAAEITDFKPEEFLGAKGLRTLDRSTKLACSGVKLALEDARLVVSIENTYDIGVAVGSTLGSIRSISEFDRDAIIDGPRYVNPALFPNTVINSPASQVSIKFNIQGFNATLSTAFCAGLDAINYAAEFIRLGRIKTVLAGGVEEFCIQTFLAFYKTGLLDGLSLGEGAGLLVLEGSEPALLRKARINAPLGRIYGEVLGYGSGFGARPGLKKAIGEALEDSGLTLKDIDYVCSGSNSNNENDVAEKEVIQEMFGSVPVVSIKALTGECYSASGSLQAIAAVGAIERGQARNALVNSFGPSGNNASLIIAKFKE